jgi:hypothetical protein
MDISFILGLLLIGGRYIQNAQMRTSYFLNLDAVLHLGHFALLVNI